MENIKQKHLDAVNKNVNKYGYLDNNTVDAAAQSCTEITIEVMDGFAKFLLGYSEISFDGPYYPKAIPELRQKYIDSLK